jgi:hypothetical protein
MGVTSLPPPSQRTCTDRPYLGFARLSLMMLKVKGILPMTSPVRLVAVGRLLMVTLVAGGGSKKGGPLFSPLLTDMRPSHTQAVSFTSLSLSQIIC